ncbi:MAG: hypothetical protein GY936_14275 [Ignavibacteriae bacterium]|nr:hypothetical protein [Ignavibacteriota bacterium]
MSSKKKKRRGEFLEREKIRNEKKDRIKMLGEATTVEEMAKAMGIPLR